MEISKSFCEMTAKRIKQKVYEYKVPLVSAIVVGLLSYLYTFTNKLINLDDVQCLFSKGGTTSSGRWGLDILSYIIPNYSMPWFHGILTILLLSAAICVIISIFQIKSKLLQGLLAGVIISFPSMTATFAFMFTSSSYAVSFLCGVLSVMLVKKGGKLNFAIAGAFFIFSVSIYQAYIAVVSSLFIVLIIQDILKNEKSSKQIMTDCVKYLIFLGLFTVIYLGVTKVILRLFKISLNTYARSRMSIDGISGILKGLKTAYEYFLLYFIPKNRVLNNPMPSAILHILCALVIIIKLVVSRIKNRSISKSLLLLACIVIFPLSINCFYLITYVHLLMLYGFIAFYVLAAVVIQELPSAKWKMDLVREFVTVSLAVMVISNIYIANRFYLQMHIIYENAYSFYTSIVTQIKENPEFTEGTKVAVIGDADNLLYNTEDFEKIYRFTDIINSYSREEFIKYYIGFDADFATEEECIAISDTEQFDNMAEYPYHGSIKKIDDYMVVKFGEFVYK